MIFTTLWKTIIEAPLDMHVFRPSQNQKPSQISSQNNRAGAGCVPATQFHDYRELTKAFVEAEQHKWNQTCQKRHLCIREVRTPATGQPTEVTLLPYHPGATSDILNSSWVLWPKPVCSSLLPEFWARFFYLIHVPYQALVISGIITSWMSWFC